MLDENKLFSEETVEQEAIRGINEKRVVTSIFFIDETVVMNRRKFVLGTVAAPLVISGCIPEEPLIQQQAFFCDTALRAQNANLCRQVDLAGSKDIFSLGAYFGYYIGSLIGLPIRRASAQQRVVLPDITGLKVAPVTSAYQKSVQRFPTPDQVAAISRHILVDRGYAIATNDDLESAIRELDQISDSTPLETSVHAKEKREVLIPVARKNVEALSYCPAGYEGTEKVLSIKLGDERKNEIEKMNEVIEKNIRLLKYLEGAF